MKRNRRWYRDNADRWEMRTADVYLEGNWITGAAVVDQGGNTYVTTSIDGFEGYTAWSDGCLPPGDYGHYTINSVQRMDDGTLHVDMSSKNPIEKAFNTFVNVLLLVPPAPQGRRRWGRVQE